MFHKMRDSKKILQTPPTFSFQCSDKNGKLIEEQNSMGGQCIQGKAKVHFCLQIQTLVGRSIGASQCALQNRSATNTSRTRLVLLCTLQMFAWIAVGSDIFHWEDFEAL